jgi:nucleoid-associated protein YgaU
MSLFSFMKEVGEKLFNPVKQASAAPAQSSPAAGGQQAQDVANGEAIKNYVASLGLKVSGLTVTYDSANYTATLSGAAADQETKEKAVLAAGNVMNVAKVDDQMTVTTSGGGEAKFHTVEKGDTLSKISKQVYGDANQYNKIFEANKPMLKSPDLIYPGQVLRIPA